MGGGTATTGSVDSSVQDPGVGRFHVQRTATRREWEVRRPCVRPRAPQRSGTFPGTGRSAPGRAGPVHAHSLAAALDRERLGPLTVGPRAQKEWRYNRRRATSATETGTRRDRQVVAASRSIKKPLTYDTGCALMLQYPYGRPGQDEAEVMAVRTNRKSRACTSLRATIVRLHPFPVRRSQKGGWILVRTCPTARFGTTTLPKSHSQPSFSEDTRTSCIRTVPATDLSRISILTPTVLHSQTSSLCPVPN
jgi:hypothetical protein